MDAQWSAIESQLFSVQMQLLHRLKSSGRLYFPVLHKPVAAAQFNNVLGKIDLDLSTAIIAFDTYLDVLSQRKIPNLGRILAGCDIIAKDALSKDHPALSIIEAPIVFCDRGFGASIIREGVSFPGNIRNPLPLLQIPYSRLSSKHELTSIIHEAGHEGLARLDLVRILPTAIKDGLIASGVPNNVAELFGLWSSEIGPDFWTFCASGVAQSSSISEILSLPPTNVFHISWIDHHPPPYLRVLLSFEWCRQQWGRGEWDDWERNWDGLYPLGSAPPSAQKFLRTARECLPALCRILFNTRFRALTGKRLPDLFNLTALDPSKIRKLADSISSGKLDLTGISPCVQLSVFRTIRDRKTYDEDFIDNIMTNWLIKLGESRLEKEGGDRKIRERVTKVNCERIG